MRIPSKHIRTKQLMGLTKAGRQVESATMQTPIGSGNGMANLIRAETLGTEFRSNFVEEIIACNKPQTRNTLIGDGLLEMDLHGPTNVRAENVRLARWLLEGCQRRTIRTVEHVAFGRFARLVVVPLMEGGVELPFVDL
jgi:hypothetical protein